MIKQLKDYINAACEIRTLENELLVIGKLHALIEHESRGLSIEITPSDGFDFPIAAYELPVKITLFGGAAGKLTLGGRIFIANKKFWRVNRLEYLSNVERRGFFRIRLQSDGKAVLLKRNSEVPTQHEQEPFPVRITNISLSGLMLQTDQLIQINDTLDLSDIVLLKEEPAFSVTCSVRWISSKPGRPNRYGCHFEDVSDQKMDSLYTAIFKLQCYEIQRKKYRL